MHYKLRLIALVGCLLIGFNTYAQKETPSDNAKTEVFSFSLPEYDITETKTAISTGTHHAFVIDIPKADIKSVEKQWIKLMKKKKAKPVGDLNETIALNAKFKEISKETINVYAVFTVKGDGVSLTSLYDLGGSDGYLNSTDHPNKAKTITNMLNVFARQFAADAIKDDIKIHKQELKDFNKEAKKLEKTSKKLQDKLVELQKMVAIAEADIQNNQVKVDTNKQKIATKEQDIKNDKKKLKVLDK